MSPRVSVIVSVFNGEAFVADAIGSALAQTLNDIEVVVADNGSTDGTWGVLARLAERDPRLRPLRADGGRGAGYGRNAALAVARGDWVAVLDADDIMHPRRLEKLVGLGESQGVSLVADNQRLVDPSGAILGLAWAPDRLPRELDAEVFIRGNLFGQRDFAFGYLKPVIRRSLLEATGHRYPPELRVAEDFHFLLALLAEGERLLLLPEALYDYAQTPGSLSRSFSAADLQAIAAANRQARQDHPALAAALAARQRSIDLGLAHGRFIQAVKAGRPAAALGELLRRPAVAAPILRFGRESLAKRLGRRWAGGRPGEEAWDGPGEEAPETPPVAYFGQDCTDNAVIRRISAFTEAGQPVLGLTFRRQKFNRDFVPGWDNIPLGETRDRDYMGRVLALVRAAWTLCLQRRRLAKAAFFYARNIDMALLAWLAQLLSRSSAPLVYEVLDVQRAFLGGGGRARLLRWVERRVLAHARLLTVSSPGFIEEYFRPVQHYRGPWFLLENKILGPQLRVLESQAVAGGGGAGARLAALRQGRWVIGWFGTLRCPRSLEILSRLAAALPDRLLVYLRGYPTETGLEPFLEVVRRHPNMIYDGEFFSPRDLRDIYGAIDFSWCFDFLDAGGNSDWLLPNRFYDSGYFGVPALAAAGTETGRRIARHGMGWTFGEPLEDSLTAFLRRVTPAELAAVKAHMAGLPRGLFCEEDDTRRLVNTILAGGPAAVRDQPQAAE